MMLMINIDHHSQLSQTHDQVGHLNIHMFIDEFLLEKKRKRKTLH